MDRNKLISLSKQAGGIIEESGYDTIIASHKLLHSRLENPQSYSAIVGETSSGKSTIINGLFSKKILPSSAKPTTGAVTQLIVNNDNLEQEFFAINRDATIEKIEQNIFNHLVEKPDKNLLRLRTVLSHHSQKYDGLNIFDTPGYNSLITEHEEVLMNFIPECDVIIHVIGYRMGFGEQDQLLLSSIYDQTTNRDGETPLILVVNRCPEKTTLSSKRIVEIHNHAKDTWHAELEIVLVPSIIQNDLENPIDVLPKAEDLWSSLYRTVNNKERENQVIESGRVNLLLLLKELSLNLEEKALLFDLNRKDLEFLEIQLKEFIDTKNTLFSILDDYTERWERVVPKILENSISNLIKSTNEIVQNDNKWLDAKSCVSYIEGHHLPFNTRKISKEVNAYFKIQLEEMNREMEDVSNQALMKLSYSVSPTSSNSYSKIITVLVNKIGMRLLGDTSKGLLKGLGGVGGVASGTGNLVKMGVKRFGNLFGKTFSKEVYNTIGRTFTKKMIQRLNVTILVATEALVYIYESKTWQKKVIKQIEKNLNEYKEDVVGEITNDTIKSIKRSNIETINEVFSTLETDASNEINKLENDKEIIELKDIKIKLNKIEIIKEKLSI